MRVIPSMNRSEPSTKALVDAQPRVRRARLGIYRRGGACCWPSMYDVSHHAPNSLRLFADDDLSSNDAPLPHDALADNAPLLGRCRTQAAFRPNQPRGFGGNPDGLARRMGTNHGVRTTACGCVSVSARDGHRTAPASAARSRDGSGLRACSRTGSAGGGRCPQSA